VGNEQLAEARVSVLVGGHERCVLVLLPRVRVCTGLE
jgi:hypothetical protein